MVVIHRVCDACGGDVFDGRELWEIELRFVSWWNPSGDARVMHLCGSCGSQAARLLGFCYDTGKILSVARGEMIDGVEVHGPNGGGIADIAINGVAGASAPHWHAEKAKELPMALMVREQAPWMRAQGYSAEMIAKREKDDALALATQRKMRVPDIRARDVEVKRYSIVAECGDEGNATFKQVVDAGGPYVIYGAHAEKVAALERELVLEHEKRLLADSEFAEVRRLLEAKERELAEAKRERDEQGKNACELFDALKEKGRDLFTAQARITALEGALAWYADEANHKPDTVDIGVGEQPIPLSAEVNIDRGSRARAALAGRTPGGAATELAASKDRLVRLRALSLYAVHDSRCGVRDGEDCDCGYSKALADFAALAEEPKEGEE